MTPAMKTTDTQTLKDAIVTIYDKFPNLSYKPRPDDVKLLAAYVKSTDTDYPKSLDLLLTVNNREIELELLKYRRH